MQLNTDVLTLSTRQKKRNLEINLGLWVFLNNPYCSCKIQTQFNKKGRGGNRILLVYSIRNII